MRKLLLVLIFLLSFINTTKASHAAGGELLYTWISDSTYKITLKFYRDCSGISEPASMTCYCLNMCTNVCISVNLTKVTSVPNGQEVSTGCPGYPSTCNGGTFPGYREWIYENTVTLPSRCNYWKFYISEAARNSGITNLVTPATQNLYIEATLNNQYAQGNSSPYFTVKPVPYVCAGNPYNYNNGAIDPNNDSLSFSIIQPRTGAASCTSIPTNIAFSNTSLYNLTNNPLSTANTFNISPTTGQISFTPDIQQIGVVSVLVSEWRNGVLIGSVMRDMQIIVKSCTIPTPTLNLDTITIAGGTWNNGRIEGCGGQSISFCFDAKSSNSSAILVVTSNNSIATPGSTVTLTNHFTDSVRTCFNWSPSLIDTGARILTFTVKDSTCTPPGIPISQTYIVPIYIWQQTNIIKDTTLCQGEITFLQVVGGTSFTWSVLPGGAGLGTLNCFNCATPIASPPITTKYVVTSNLINICSKYKDTVTITVNPLPIFNLGPDTVTCINNSLLLNTNLTPVAGTNYNIRWFPSNFLNNDTISTPICTPTKDTTYIVKITPNGLNRCARYDTLKIKVLQGFKLHNNDTAICAGNTVNINLTGDNRYTYTWTPNLFVSNPNIMSPSITPDTSRLYTIKASKTGCKDSLKTIYIDVQPNPIVFIGADRTICYGDTIQCTSLITPGTYPFYNYTWTPNGAFNNPIIANPIFNGVLTQNVKLTVTTPIGCTGNDDAAYTVVPTNFLTPFVSKQLCPGDTAQLLNTFPVVWIHWYPNLYIDSVNSNNPKVWPPNQFSYLAVAQEATGCIDSTWVLVDVKSSATITLPDTVTLFPGDSYQFNPGGNCLYFTWFPLNGLNNPNISSPTTSVQSSIIYTIDAETEFGCKTTDSVVVVVEDDSEIDVANAFTPDSEPNSIIKVQHHGIAKLGHFRIFNRWGQKVFETTNIDEGWDGTFNNTPQPIGIYIYTAEAYSYKGKRFYKQGNITLLR